MDDPLQRALDGDLDLDDLDAGQRARVAEAERLMAAVVASIATRPIPDLSEAVLARLDAGTADPSPRGSWWRWLWQPRAVAVAWRPAYGLVAALVVVAAAILLRGGRSSPTMPGPEHQILARFELNAPEAHQVSLAGEFTGWQPDLQLKRNAAGVWTVVVPLEPGVYQYAFVVDGERWMPDPAVPSYDDGFGGHNSRLALLAADGVPQ